MLTALKAYSPLRNAPLLPLGSGGAESDLLQIRKIEGLNPVEGKVNTAPYGSVDGESYSGSTVSSRNIVLTIGSNPDWIDHTFESLRQILYAYFMPKMNVRLVFHSTYLPPVEISGYVETCEPNIFSKDPEMVVSIICPYPYFTALEPTVLNGQNNETVDIEYAGTIETGIVLTVSHSSGNNAPNIDLQVGNPETNFFFVQLTNLVSPQKYFTMSSIPGEKRVQQVDMATGLIANILYRLEEPYTWPVLQPGSNHFQVVTTQGVQDWELSYFEKFGGL